MSSNSDIIIEAQNIKFCPGPCNDTTPEPSPNKSENEVWYTFKPHSVGRYERLSYPMSNGGELILKNVRICRSCCHRHIEFEEEGYTEYLLRDGNTILEKLKKSGFLN